MVPAPVMAKFSDLIDELYGAALDAERLRVFLRLLAAHLQATTSTIIATDTANSTSSFQVSFGIDAAYLESYAAEYAKEDLWQIGAERLRLPAGCVTRGHELVDDDVLFASRFYQEHLREIDIFHWLGVLLQPSPTQRFLVAVQRPHAAGRFDTSHAEQLGALKPHLLRAAQIMQHFARLERQQGVLKSALDQSDMGLVFVRPDGSIAHANRNGLALLESNDGLFMDGHGRIAAARAGEDRALQQLLGADGDSTPHAGELSIARPSGKRPYSVLALTAVEDDFWLLDDSFVTLLLIGDPERPQGMPDAALRGAYALTRREAQLALAIMAGRSLKQAADALNITENTARSYLRIIFRKTRTASQSELLRLLFTLPANR